MQRSVQSPIGELRASKLDIDAACLIHLSQDGRGWVIPLGGAKRQPTFVTIVRTGQFQQNTTVTVALPGWGPQQVLNGAFRGPLHSAFVE